MEAEKLTERLCQSLYDADPVGVSDELVRLARINAPWPDILCGVGAYAAQYRVTDWFSVHWLCSLVASYLIAERVADPLEKLFPFIQGVWLLSGSGESSFLGFKGLAAGRKAQRLKIPKPQVPLPACSAESVSDRFLAAFRQQQTEDCQAILVGAWRAARSRGQIKEMILRAATDQFAMTGHPLIQAVRVFRLLDRTDWRYADWHLACMIPPMLGALTAIDEFPSIPTDDEARINRWLAIGEKSIPRAEARGLRPRSLERGDSFLAYDLKGVVATLLYGSPQETIDTIASLLDQGVSAGAVCHYITLAMSQRILNVPRPDTRDPSERNGWAFYMGQPQHVMTAIEPLREVLASHPSPATFKGLFQEALFLNSIKHREQASPHPDFAPVTLTEEEASTGAEELLERLRAAINQEKGGLAAALTAGYLRAGHEAERVRDLFLDVQRHGFSPFTIPEHDSHGIKFIQSVVDEYEVLPPAPPVASRLLIAAAKVIAGFTRKDHTLMNHLREALKKRKA
jgi:hypothetical protein